MRAVDIITDAYERMNRLSPGEPLNADDQAFGLRRLNLLVDELSASREFLFRSALTSAAQSGHITLGAGAWAAIDQGEQIISATADNLPLAPITMQQFNELYQPTTTGRPTVWAQDGMATVYLWPVPTGQTIKLQTQATVSEFADLTTDYTAAAGWRAGLGAALAVRCAPTLLGRLPAELARAEKRAMDGLAMYEPAIIDNVNQIQARGSSYPPRLF
jgi:hypothetical protein